MYMCTWLHVFDCVLHVDSAKFPRERFSEDVQQVPKNAPPPTTPLSISLTSEENMLTNLRDCNFRAVGRLLSKHARDISAAFEVMYIHNVSTCLWSQKAVSKIHCSKILQMPNF